MIRENPDHKGNLLLPEKSIRRFQRLDFFRRVDQRGFGLANADDGAGDGFEFRRRSDPDGVKLFDVAVVVTGEAGRGNAPVADAAFLVGRLGGERRLRHVVYVGRVPALAQVGDEPVA